MKGLFIDDKDTEAQLAKVLTGATNNELVFSFRRPDLELTDLAEFIWNEGIQILALDYRLDEQQTGPDPKNKFRAGSLAQLLRERAVEQTDKDIPIILVSVEENVRRFYRPDLTAHDLFDRTYTKDQVVHKTIGREIVSVASGYPKLVNYLEERDLCLLLDTNQSDTSYIQDEEILELSTLSAPHQLSRRIFEMLIDRPGKLLRPIDLLARLGISKDSDDISRLHEVLAAAAVSYSGVFHGGWPRWWDHRLRSWARELWGQDLGNDLASARVKRLNDHFQLNLSPAISRWTGSSDAKFAVACASCDCPTEIQYSVAAVDRARYKLVERKRICWSCVQSGEFEDAAQPSGEKLKIDSAGALVSRKLQNGEIKQNKVQ